MTNLIEVVGSNGTLDGDFALCFWLQVALLIDSIRARSVVTFSASAAVGAALSSFSFISVHMDTCCPIQAINRSTSPFMATASSQRISLLFFFLCGSLDLGSAKAMAKLLVLLAIALLAISIADSGSKVLAKATEHSEEEYMPASNGQGTLRTYQCPSQCTRRCSKTQYHKPCMFFCQKCCMKCLCVPSGFYGNKGECPCYNNWKTKRGGPKCP